METLALNKSIKIFFNYFLSPIIFCWIIYDIYKQLKDKMELQDVLCQIWSGFHWVDLIGLLFVFLLMILHLMIESIKFKKLLQTVFPISIPKSFIMVLGGMAFANASPNRVAEFAGRVVHLPVSIRKEGTVFTWISGLTQMIPTLFVGGIFLFFQKSIDDTSTENKFLNLSIEMLKWLTPIFFTIFVLLFFGLGANVLKISKLGNLKYLDVVLHMLRRINLSTRVSILTLSFLRFFIFLMQYFLLFKLFHLQSTFFEVLVSVSVMFLIISILPSISLLELGLRSKILLMLMSGPTSQTLGVISVVTLIWLINFILPAFMGSFGFLGSLFVQSSEKPQLH